MPEPATLPRSGLYTTSGAAVPLAGVSIHADISNLSARVAIAQRFVNTEQTPIEATYLFPLDEAAAVCGFEAIVDGTLVVGEVKPREEAFEAYDDAMARGDGAYLLDEERPDVFQASVGNLPPGREVLLKITYVAELPVSEGRIRFAIPTTVSPRYAPADDQVGVGRPDSETLNPPVAWTVPYGLDLSVRIDVGERPGRIESPSHPIAVTLEGNESVVTLSQRDAALDRDFVLSIDAGALDEPRAWIEREDDGRQAIAIGFAPRLPDTQAAADVIFVVDRSGSMEGASIAEVRNALQLCLRSLVAGCRFNIIGFGSHAQALFPGSRDYNEASLREASEHVARLQADLGGTEILPALKLALDAPPHPGLPRQVVVLTDGEVTNTDAVLALARSHAATARIFTFGIGAGASHHLVKGLARAAGGSAEFIYPGERTEPKVVRQLGRLLSPALTNVRVDWGGLDVTQAPAGVPPVFAGGRLILYGFVRRPLEPARVRLTADSPSGPLAFAVPVDPGAARAGSTVAALAARARIRELEESPEWLETRGSRQRERKASAATREIVDLAVRYGLVSRETSYVAIERRDTPVVGDVQLRRVPIALTTGWGGVGRRAVLAAPAHAVRGSSMEAMPPASYSLDDGESDQGAEFHLPRLTGAFRLKTDEPQVPYRRQPPRPAARRDPRHDAMVRLASLQRADGSWELTDELLQLVGAGHRASDPILKAAAGDPEEVRRAWATALALVWLEREASALEDEWRLLARKAHAWLNRTPVLPGRDLDWLSAAARL